MDKLLLKNQNFDLIMALADHQWDIFELVFGFLNHDTVETCRKVSKDWDISLEKISRVKFLEEFGHKKVDDVYDYGFRPLAKVLTVIPGWQRAVKKYAAQATNEDLMEVQEAIKKLVMRDDKCWPPVHYAAAGGSVKLLKLILMSSYDMNTREWTRGWTPLHLACFYGRTETVQWFIQCSKEHEIDLNARDDQGNTVLHLACYSRVRHTKTVRLIMNNLKEFAIDMKDAQNNNGKTALDLIKKKLKRNTKNYDKFIECSKILRQEM